MEIIKYIEEMVKKNNSILKRKRIPKDWNIILPMFKKKMQQFVEIIDDHHLQVYPLKFLLE